MRPRKKVLLFGFDEVTLSLTAYPLGLRDFTIFTATTPDEFRGMFAAHMPAVVLFIRDSRKLPFDELSGWAKELDPQVQTMIAIRSRRGRFDGVADSVLRNADMAELRQSLKILTARKRGPKAVERHRSVEELRKAHRRITPPKKSSPRQSLQLKQEAMRERWGGEHERSMQTVQTR